MKDVPCRHSADVHEALRSGKWSAELRRHIATCPNCRQEVGVQKWLHQFAQEMQAGSPPVLPEVVWLKARLVEKQEAQKRALRPFVYLQVMAEIFLGVALIIVIIWNQTVFERWLETATFENLASSLRVFEGGISLTFVLFFAVVLLGLGMLITFNACMRKS